MAEPPGSSSRAARDEAGALRRALELAAARGDVDALNQLGHEAMERGDLSEAEGLFRRAAADGDATSLYNYGYVREEMGDRQEAADAYRAAAEAGYGPALESRRRVLGLEDAPSPAPQSDDAPDQFSLAARAVSDLPAEEDLLGFAPLVEGLRALLSVRRTTLPLAVAIGAPWGAGKSSVMLQLQKLLCEPGDRQPQERKWWTVSFPAWKYEHSERLWAALAKAIYEQPQEHMGVVQRMWFRLRVEWERLGWRKFLLKGVWPPIAAAGAVAAAMAANVDPKGTGGGEPTLVASIGAFWAAAAYYWGLASKPFKRAMERYASAPDYEQKVGFTADADRDIKSLARVLAPDTEKNPRALAVFVDDLDRCTSTHVVEVVEAMNQIFNSDGRHGCVFVLGLDREVVATNIEVAYGPTVEWLRKAKRAVGDDFGMHFLAKLVQLSVTVPEPSAAATERLLSSITGNQARDGRPVVEQEDVVRAEEEIREQAPGSLEEVAEASSTVDASPEAREAARRRVLAERLRDSPEVAEAEFEVLELLDRNPRQIKRFDNAFRLQLYVANEDRDCKLDFSLDELIALGKWVALRLRWPELAEALDDEPLLIDAIEAKANETLGLIREDELIRLEGRYGRWFDNREVREFLSDEVAARRVSTLEPGSFLRVA